jgi:hypothetical protein
MSEGDGAAESGSAFQSDGGCQPMNVAGFMPRTFQYVDAGGTACNGFGGDGGLIQAYGDACLGHQASLARCTAFRPPDDDASAACFSCLTTIEGPDAGPYGAVAVVTIPFVDYPACIAAVDPTPAGAACALALSQVSVCAEYACKSACPVVDDPSAAAFNSCFSAAMTDVCSRYGTLAMDCLIAYQSDPSSDVARTCFPGTAEDNYLSVARLLCGN